ncbi:MAG: hypothetical protein U0228_34885 [Myxococcaceae bacterium]
MIRWWLLAEDPRHERLALAIARRFGLKSEPVKAMICPAGSESAFTWVLKNFPERVRNTVRRRPTERVALVVMIDGDNQGVRERKRQLAAELAAAGETPRTAAEAIVLLVPTWSVETWLLRAADESQSFKNQLRHSDDVKATYESVATVLREGPAPRVPPSLDDAADELKRLPEP